MPHLDMNNRWSDYAKTISEEPPRKSKPGASALAKGAALAPKLQSLALTPAEKKHLLDKGLLTEAGKGKPIGIDKAVLDLVPLAHPVEGWRVLIGLVAITPPLAQRWLKNNFNNRPMKEDVVDSYARDAKAGQFVTTHQGIAFGDDDALLDGQHRLAAIIKGGTPCVLFVSFGWPVKLAGARMTRKDIIDRGKPRSVADQLKIEHGMKEGRTIAMTCRTLASLCAGERVCNPSVGQVLEVFAEFKAGVMYAITHRSKQHGLRQAGVLAAFALAYDSDPKRIGPLFASLNTGEGLKPKSPLTRLRDFLVSDEAAFLSRSNDRGLSEMTLNALRLELLAMPCSQLHVSNEGTDWFKSKQPARIEQIAKLFLLPEAKTI